MSIEPTDILIPDYHALSLHSILEHCQQNPHIPQEIRDQARQIDQKLYQFGQWDFLYHDEDDEDDDDNDDTQAKNQNESHSLEIAIREKLQQASSLASELDLEPTQKIDFLQGVISCLSSLPTQKI